MAEHNLTLAQYDVLLRLAKAPEPALRMSQIADRVLVSPSGVTRVVDGLEDRGYVKRERSPDDARVVSEPGPSLYRTSLPSSTQTSSPTVTVASVKKFQRSHPPPTAPPSSVLSPSESRTTPSP